MTIKNIGKKRINESLNNIVVQFIHGTHNDIFIYNEIIIIFNIFSLPLHNI